jgi:YesN/AraC family two-component response regulator
METMAAPGLPISILIVEDEVIALLSLVTTLAKKYPKVTLHQATNGRMGLDLFKTHLPDIVITDLNMPDMGGAQMAEIIHGIKPDTKFIVLTGYSEKLTLKGFAGNEVEIAHYIVKPVFFKELFAAVEQCIEEITSQKNIQLSPKR